jgi:hypothetical protein
MNDLLAIGLIAVGVFAIGFAILYKTETPNDYKPPTLSVALDVAVLNEQMKDLSAHTLHLTERLVKLEMEVEESKKTVTRW